MILYKNNLSPRLSATYDIWGTGNTLIIGGVNRYYGRSMLTYALYGAQNAGLQHCYFDCQTSEKSGLIVPTLMVLIH